MLSPVLEPPASTILRRTESGAQSDLDGLPLPRRYAAVAAILGAIVLVVLDGAIANVALPSMAQQLHAAPAGAVWIITAYQLVIVMFLLPASAVGERLGYRRVFTAGIALFTVASLLWALAPSLPWSGGALLVVSAASLVLLVRREMPKAAPLIPLDLLRVRSFRISIVASVCCFTGQMMGYVALPFYFQHELGLSAMATGLLM